MGGTARAQASRSRRGAVRAAGRSTVSPQSQAPGPTPSKWVRRVPGPHGEALKKPSGTSDEGGPTAGRAGGCLLAISARGGDVGPGPRLPRGLQTGNCRVDSRTRGARPRPGGGAGGKGFSNTDSKSVSQKATTRWLRSTSVREHCWWETPPREGWPECGGDGVARDAHGAHADGGRT